MIRCHWQREYSTLSSQEVSHMSQHIQSSYLTTMVFFRGQKKCLIKYNAHFKRGGLNIFQGAFFFREGFQLRGKVSLQIRSFALFQPSAAILELFLMLGRCPFLCPDSPSLHLLNPACWPCFRVSFNAGLQNGGG